MHKGLNQKSKYRSQAVNVDGHRFASKLEAKRYGELFWLEKAGKIRGLVLQPRYPLEINGKHVCTYVADFSFFEAGKAIVEDAKGYRTDIYRLKRKMFLAAYPDIVHREVTA